MARTEEQLRAWYGEHPEGGMRCTDDECIQCEMRNLLADISELREALVTVWNAYGRVTTERHLLEPTRPKDEEELDRLNAAVEAAGLVGEKRVLMLESFPVRGCPRTFAHAAHEWQDGSSWFRCDGRGQMISDLARGHFREKHA